MVVALGIVMILGTGLAAGVQLYRRNLSIYRNMAYSYVRLATANIEGDRINEIVARGDEIREIELGLSEAVMKEDWEQSGEFSGRLQEDPELNELYGYWQSVDWFIFSSGHMSSEIRFFYVVIPEEEDLVYLWDSDTEQGEFTHPLDHAAYGPGEKENLMKAFRGEWDNSLAIYNEEHEVLGTAMLPIYDGNNKIVAVAALDVSISGIRRSFIILLANITVMITLIMLAAGLLYFAMLQRQIIRPIVTLEKATRDLVEDLSSGREGTFRVDVHTGDEIEVLAHSFEEMESRLKEYVRENAAISAERQRISTELDLANRIQADMLPGIFPPFPDRTDFDIYASMTPAKEVGGDFYDFFLVDEDHLGMVMADVAGKGIPAALFMMMSKIMLQNYTLAGLGPKEVLETVNAQICENNREQMFVTVWLGILDLKTGKVRAANAGHEYPILKMPGGAFELIRDKHGFVLGAMEGIRYHEYELTLKPGSCLFLYTDGLAEATDSSEKMFGTDGILETLNREGKTDPQQVLSGLDRAVNAFVGDAPQFDDLTMLCLKYEGPGS